MSIIIAIIIFGLIVVVHEYGHFIAARKCGVMVEEFAIGMGPTILKKKKGETIYSWRIFPIGGFCKMLGEDTDNMDPRSFNSKSLPRRAIILAAGALMNFLLAFVLFLVLVLFGIYAMPQVSSVAEGSPAEEAGLMAGDRITKLNGTTIHLFEDISFELSSNRGTPVEVEFKRGKEKHLVIITPYLDQDSQYKIGFRAESCVGLFNGTSIDPASDIKRAGLWESLQSAYWRIIFFIRVTFVGITRLVTFQLPLADMSGPIGIVNVISSSYTEVVNDPTMKSPIDTLVSILMTMANLCAMLSANLGVFNILPLPALDGGRLVFVAFEAIRRKPVPVEKEGFIHFVGFVLLMLLAVFIAYSDIRKLL
jgi:regulator of sigma E protease